ncbi:hypothetical protein F7725_012450 [Dissostichus mawsoni]|uniref:HECT domain-containing protein n=1 Tax=Dissostichus mawsoni TaxID=36200 RepID=A0A7J5YQX1_DISMA|nr:hypothetical protein F7725_012450 [Dissostichus mawsoni]
MYCPRCGKTFQSLQQFCSSCGCIKRKINMTGPAAPKMPSLKTFLEYRSKKSDERLNFSCQKRKVKKKEQTSTVQVANMGEEINIGIMSLQKDIMKPVRGKTLILDPDTDATGLHRLAVKKMTDFNSDLDEGPYVLIYPDTSEVINIPGWSAIKMSLTSCFPIGEQQDASDSDQEVFVRRKRVTEVDLAFPGNLSMKVLQKALQRKQALPGHQIRVKRKRDTSISATQIIEDLAYAIDHNTVSRFNITHSNVWDGAVRGFRRSTFCEKSDLLVRFMDDAGSVEEGIDADDSCFHCSWRTRPHFLSRDLVNHIAGQPGFCAHVTDVTDDEIGRALSETELAHSLKSLQDVLLKHSSMLQTAGCFRHVSSVEEKHCGGRLPYLVHHRQESQFKDGLASLHFLDALCQHPSVLAPVLCHTDKKLTSVEVERLFLPQLSPAGSNRRTTETVALSFWADYLMDCEEQGPVSLEELFMFITGLKTQPPAGMTPHPCVTFSQETIYPMANTCANTITLPRLETYARFKANMDFGIENSPGFGCL